MVTITRGDDDVRWWCKSGKIHWNCQPNISHSFYDYCSSFLLCFFSTTQQSTAYKKHPSSYCYHINLCLYTILCCSVPLPHSQFFYNQPNTNNHNIEWKTKHLFDVKDALFYCFCSCRKWLFISPHISSVEQCVLVKRSGREPPRETSRRQASKLYLSFWLNNNFDARFAIDSYAMCRIFNQTFTPTWRAQLFYLLIVSLYIKIA